MISFDCAFLVRRWKKRLRNINYICSFPLKFSSTRNKIYIGWLTNCICIRRDIRIPLILLNRTICWLNIRNCNLLFPRDISEVFRCSPLPLPVFSAIEYRWRADILSEFSKTSNVALSESTCPSLPSSFFGIFLWTFG